jgi:hypothetical protein
VALSAVWVTGVIRYAPAPTVFLPGAITGIAAVLVDYVWFYRAGRREVLLRGRPAPPRFIALWLVFWFDFLIAFNMGTYLGVMLHAGPTSETGMLATAAYCLWFWILTPTCARLLADMGVGRAVVVTTRRVGSGLSWGRLGASVLLHAIVYFALLSPAWEKSLQLFAIGMLTAGGMELPLYVLGIRPGRDAWKTFLLNTLVEWNYAAPLLYALLHAMGRAF